MYFGGFNMSKMYNNNNKGQDEGNEKYSMQSARTIGQVGRYYLRVDLSKLTMYTINFKATVFSKKDIDK